MTLRRLGLPVPPGFVIGAEACRVFLRTGRFPDGLDAELTAAVHELEHLTGRRLGGPGRPLVVSVRSGAAVSMPGMMSTILDLGLTTEATAGLAAETGDPRFALESRLRFLAGYAAAVHGLTPDRLVPEDVSSGGLVSSGLVSGGMDAVPREAPDRGTGGELHSLARAVRAVEELIAERAGEPVPDDAMRQLWIAVTTVFSSWHTPRARTYRDLHDIPHDLGTAVIVQVMAFGNRDGHSGAGVAFSRDPNTGENIPFGDVVFGRQGEDVVSGRSAVRPLAELADREPLVWDALLDALDRIEGHFRDACQVEFTVEAGRLWLLQVRSGGLTGHAAVRVAVDLAAEGVISRREALLRVSGRHLRDAHTARLDTTGPLDVFTRGVGACPGVATGAVATTAGRAVRMAGSGPVVLVRPQTSPMDMHGLAAAAGVLTAGGGPSSHAAVVARSMGKPAVVGAAGLTVDEAAATVRAGGRTLPEGTVVTIDGTGGVVVVGSPRVVTAAADPHLHRLLRWADEVAGAASGATLGAGDGPGRTDQDRLAAAHAVLREHAPPHDPHGWP